MIQEKRSKLPEWFSPDENEEVKWVGEPSEDHIKISTPGIAITSIIIAGIVWGVSQSATFGILTFLVTAGAITGLYYLEKKYTDYLITNKRVYTKSGKLSQSVETAGLENIQNTKYDQSAVQSLFDVGTTKISTAGGSGVEIKFKNINNPQEVDSMLQNMTEGKTSGIVGQERGVPQQAGSRIEPETIESLAKETRRLRRQAEKLEEKTESSNTQGDENGEESSRKENDSDSFEDEFEF